MSQPPPDRVWTLGVSSAKDKRGIDKENKGAAIYNQRVEVTDKDTLFDLTRLLCNGPIKDRRESDYTVDAHLWTLTIYQAGVELAKRVSDEMMDGPHIAERCIGPTDKDARPFKEFEGDDGEVFVKLNTKIEELTALEVGGCVHLSYDMGAATDLFLAVLSVEEADADSCLRLVRDDEVDIDADQHSIKGVLAYKLAKKKQIDAFYPKFSAAFLGKTKKLEQAILGLSSRVSRHDDSTFAAIQEAKSQNDVFFSPLPFENMDEFLTLAEKSWVGSDSDRWLFPPTPEGKQAYENVKNSSEGDTWASNQSLFYQSKIEPHEGFSFAKTFPLTAEQFSSGCFRWIRYQRGVLQVIVGRSDRDRQVKKDQVLRTWTRKFRTLHELLCAVEASWTLPGDPSKPLGSTLLSKYDFDLGPSNPLPPEPQTVGKAEEAVVVSPPKDLPRVTAVALIGNLLYTGHHDGSLRKWDLETNKVLWRVKVFRDWTTQEPKFTDFVTGVRGITIHETIGGSHSLYTWAHYIEDALWDERKPAKIKVVHEDGTLSHILSCKLGEDNANPLISCITYGLRADKDKWRDTLFVGLEASALIDDYKNDYEDYDIEYAQDIAEGNILPFDTVDRKALDSWRGHHGPVRSIAVVSQKYLISVAEWPRTMFPESVIMWDLKNPGVPLQRIDFYTEDERGKFPPFHCTVGGIAISLNKVVLGCEYGDTIVAIDLEDNDGNPMLNACGFAKLGQRHYEDSCFHGCMAGCGSIAALVNESSSDVYIFSVDTLSTNANLTKDMTKKFSDDQEDDDEDDMKVLKARSMAAGVISFPRKGEVNASTKRKAAVMLDGSEDDDSGDIDWFGDDSGGPECLAMSENWLVATFGNGGVMKSALPRGFAANGNVLMRASTRPACGNEEIETPHLEYIDSDDDEPQPRRPQGEPCVIM